MVIESIPSRLFEQGRTRGDSPAYFVKNGAAWEATSWADFAAQTRVVARALIGLGVEAGGAVCILGFNRPEWVCFDVGAMAIGAVPAGIYTTCSATEVQYIVHHAEASVVLVEDTGQWEKIRQERANLPNLQHVVLMQGADTVVDDMVLSWDAFLAKAEGVEDSAVDARMEALKADDLATLIYTSGTTGPPKGVMLSHDNLAWTAKVATTITEVTEVDCSLSYLPLSHIAEQMFTVHVPITVGSMVYFAESMEKLKENIAETRPTVIFGVPRVWEKFHAGIGAKLSLATGVKAKLVAWARGVGSEVSALRNAGKEPGLTLGIQHAIANKLIFSKLKAALGLDRSRILVSGAAPIAREVLEFFASLDLVINEVYGQSEDTGPTTFNLPGRTRFGTVGQRIEGVEVEISTAEENKGEIVVRGRNVFLGYYKEPAATADALKDGWLQSGDLGAFDADGFLTITGRSKDILITAGGKNVAPKNLESAIKNNEIVAEAVVVGDRRKYLTAVVTLDPDAVTRFATSKGIPEEEVPGSDAAKASIQATIDEMNSHLAQVETVKKFLVLSRAFTDGPDGELTPTMKVKRAKVYEHFADEIETMYAG